MASAAQPSAQEVPQGPPPFFSLANAFSWAKIIFIILFIKGCVIDQYTVPSGSMEPTIHGDPGYFSGDRILVNKWKLGVRIPFTTTWLHRWGQLNRWDIVVFKPLPHQSDYPILVKRVVGLPGEKVRLHNGQLYVNDKLVEFPDFMPKDEQYFNAEDIRGIAQRTSNDWERRNALGLLSVPHDKGPERDRGKVGPLYACRDEPEYTVVPEGHYFVLGDNSFESLDARFWGWLPEEQILGPVFAIWWPFSSRKDFTGFSHTWWGTGLIYGIPLLIIGMEVRIQLQERRRRRLLAAQAGAGKPAK